MRIAQYGRSDLVPLVEFWNKYITPVTPKLFEERVVKHALFDPEGLMIAKENKRIVGFAHACRVGSTGHVCFIFVQPHYRKKGIGSQLLKKALDYLSPCRDVWAAKHFDTPFYGNKDGPFPPLYGSAEFVGLDAGDGETTRFFERRGFHLSHRSIEMECMLRDVPKHGLKRLGEKYYFFSTKNIAPWDKVPYQKKGDFFVDFAVDHAGSLLGAIVWYRLGEEVAGIYDVHIEQHWRDRGIGTWLLTKALEHMGKEKFMRAALVTTEFDRRAVHVYEKVGFKPNKYYSNFMLKQAKA